MWCNKYRCTHLIFPWWNHCIVFCLYVVESLTWNLSYIYSYIHIYMYISARASAVCMQQTEARLSVTHRYQFIFSMCCVLVLYVVHVSCTATFACVMWSLEGSVCAVFPLCYVQLEPTNLVRFAPSMPRFARQGVNVRDGSLVASGDTIGSMTAAFWYYGFLIRPYRYIYIYI